MSKTSFDNYGILAKQNLNYTEIAGRRLFQKTEEKKIIYDLIQKMELSANDKLLEIGCGTGAILIPLSFLVNSATGIDHPDVIASFKERIHHHNIRLISGNFLDIDVKSKYSKILIYSVLQCLSDENEVIKFIEKALSCLKPDGILLVGDIPNIDKKSRFLKTDFGHKIQKSYDQKVQLKQYRRDPKIYPELPVDRKTVTLDDKIILKILLTFRNKGFETYLFPQPYGLSFCYTRDDIIIKRPKQ